MTWTDRRSPGSVYTIVGTLRRGGSVTLIDDVLRLRATEDQPLPTVQLRHTLSDGTWHIDWMIARPADAGGDTPGKLVTFRSADRIDALEPGQGLDLERIPDHRRDFLEFEGPVSGGRGRVVRLTRGMVQNVQFEPPNDDFRHGMVQITISWEGDAPSQKAQSLVLAQAETGGWRVDCVRTWSNSRAQ